MNAMTAELPLDEPITVVDHDPRWASQAARTIDDVKLITGARDIEHIGSTAVPGLPAKPIIDLMADVTPADHDAVARELTAAGFTDFGEISAGRRYLVRRTAPATNVHLIVSTSSLWADNLAFRDYLRSHPDASRAYCRAKRHAASRERLLAYSDTKAPMVLEILRIARTWATGSPKGPPN